MTTEQLQAIPETITLHGARNHDDENYIELNGTFLNYRQSLKIIDHSPTGFNWGYGGSGPAQLALAILLEYMPVKYATKFHMDFKWEVIATIKEEEFKIEIPLREIITNFVHFQKQKQC